MFQSCFTKDIHSFTHSGRLVHLTLECLQKSGLRGAAQALTTAAGVWHACRKFARTIFSAVLSLELVKSNRRRPFPGALKSLLLNILSTVYVVFVVTFG
jgi:hypothetical protein